MSAVWSVGGPSLMASITQQPQYRKNILDKTDSLSTFVGAKRLYDRNLHAINSFCITTPGKDAAQNRCTVVYKLVTKNYTCFVRKLKSVNCYVVLVNM